MGWTCHILSLVFRVTMYDYQAMCKPSNQHHSAARPLASVSVTLDLSSARQKPSTYPKMRSPGPLSHSFMGIWPQGPTLD